ncbi:CRISPR-associated endonuclease Cas3'' [Saccharospirillum salsuginis]|uniref:CRISPR-associated helicase/endonuclease Cas3 n=1 Tax=Saccharospirillum salsuginis TaxID=418750 RepID=A0A918KA67_9GAMM|nr:CRISPR-associated endonuclease Cas3'' [Saccharospirillum salsuginis]GGX56680.1 CRISPR-associated helicase/endonuclease Cas3 [Saccharospirillum salsuginis]
MHAIQKPVFYAHSTGSTDQCDWHLLSAHLLASGHLAAEFAKHFGASDLAEVAGRLHDVGKYTQPFQRRLYGDSVRVDHSTRGAQIVTERYGQLGKLIAYGIAGHHAGLANGRDSGARTPLQVRLKDYDLPPLDPYWKQEIALSEKLNLPPCFKPREGREHFQLSMLGRMLFSSLVDADFRDTEYFYSQVEGEVKDRTGFPSLESLRNELNKTLSTFKADTDVNKLRARILAHGQEKAALEPGLFSLTVPTGGGKTLTSLSFALDHAIRHGQRRVIYVIPFTSIVEQNAAVFRKALGPLGEAAVLEHHSTYQENPSENPESIAKLRLAMENWEAPIIVTTAVQFFESLFADRPSKCRKLHNIANSVVILDEAQTLPLPLLRPCVAAMDELALNYRSSVVLCTATQPALKAQDEFKGGLSDVRELAPDPLYLYGALKRVQLRHVGPLSDDNLSEAMQRREQALCIVNNRRHARALYERISGEPGAYHLTTLMCAKHRSMVLAKVRKELKAGRPCRLISTSLIEAGVDVDFPTVLRAETGLDSIAQAAGRCNREGKRAASDSEVLVFSVADEWPTPTELAQYAQAARSIFRQFPDDPMSLEAINAYFRELYWQKGDSDLDRHQLLERVKNGQIDNIPYEWMAEKFRMIESTMIPIIIPFDDSARRALRDLAFADKVGGIARQLQPYLVQIPAQGYKSLESAGAIQPVAEERFGEQFMELVNTDVYSDHYGLNWDEPAFIRADTSVF